MSLLLIVEDSADHRRIAVDAAQRAGFEQFEIAGFATDALLYLEKAIDGQVPLPAAMMIDLVLYNESGFELLRFWRGNPTLRHIPTVVWSMTASETQRQICLFFGVTRFVCKEDDPKTLIETLAAILQPADRGEPR